MAQHSNARDHQPPSHRRSSTKRAEPIHSIHAALPGRMRLHVAPLRRHEERCRYFVELARQQSSITHASADPRTGNVLLTWHCGSAHDTVLAWVHGWARTLGFASSAPPPAQATAPVAAPAQALASSGKVVALRPRRGPAQAVATALGSPDPNNWHRLGILEVLERLQTSLAQGLSPSLAQNRLSQYGPNALPVSPPRSQLSMFLEQFASLPTALLGASAVVAVATGGITDAVIIGVVVLTNACIGFFTERQAERTLSALNRLGQRTAPVLREGRILTLPVEDVVPGDVLVLSPGTAVAADGRLLDVTRLSMDESALTGESLPVKKTLAAIERDDLPLADRSNMVYMGTHATGGSGLAAVVETGSRTELGKIQALLGSAQAPDTPLERQLDALGRQLVWLSAGICAGVFGVGLLRGTAWLPMLQSAISLAVAAVPEGLPTVATTTLALGIRNMRRENVLIRHLDAVETLGAMQTLCLDKTGTLTINKMTTVVLHTEDQRIDIVDGLAQDALGPVQSVPGEACAARLLRVAVLCSDTALLQRDGRLVLDGSATENALVDLAMNLGMDVEGERLQRPRQLVQYRAEQRNFMVTVHGEVDANQRYVAVKGSPVEVLGLCDTYLSNGFAQPLDEETRRRLLALNEEFAGRALRVLGFAERWLDADADAAHAAQGLTWLGLSGMMDPTRKGMAELMGRFHAAGIDTVMITGDQSATAYAIAKELRLNNGGPIEILDSTRLDTLEPDVLAALAQRVQVFSRVSPAHKLQIVQALQRAGRVVGMTGDGINDSPALKAADIGVAMGNSGTEVARSVADVVIADDNLHTMATAVEQGRTIYNNIRKSVHFLLSTNASEIEVMFTTTALGLGHAINPLQLLWINLISDVAPALALAVEPPEPDVMGRTPRDPKRPIMDAQDLKRVGFESAMLSAGTLAAFGYGLRRYGMGPQTSTLAFMTLTVTQLAHAFSCRSETHRLFDAHRLPPNRSLVLASGASFVLQMLTPYIPPLRSLLRLAPLGPLDMAVVLAGAGIPFLINEATKGRLLPTVRNGEPVQTIPTRSGPDTEPVGDSKP